MIISYCAVVTIIIFLNRLSPVSVTEQQEHLCQNVCLFIPKMSTALPSPLCELNKHEREALSLCQAYFNV